MVMNTYDQLIREYFDISDNSTRKSIIALKEDVEQSQLLSALANALYDKIVDKVDDIDFGTIPRSRGDITKIENYDGLMECINILRKIVIEYKQDPKFVDIVLTAANNIKSRKTVFIKGYSMEAEFPIMTYNLIVLSIVTSVSFLIATCIEYIKDPASGTITAALDKVAYSNTKDNLLFEQLDSFNNSCSSGELDSVLNEVLKNGGKFRESALYEEFDTEEYVCTMTPDCTCPICSAKRIKIANREPQEGNEIRDQVPNAQSVVDPFSDEDDQKPVTPGINRFEKSIAQDIPAAQDINPSDIPVNGSAVEEIGFDTILDIGASAYNVGKTIIKGGAQVITFPLRITVYIIKSIIPFLRNVTYFFINTRAKISDIFDVQAQFLELNAMKLEYSTNSGLDDEKKEKVVQKQLKKANKLKIWANRFSIESKKAKKDALQQIKADSNKMKIDDIQDQLPDDVKSSIALF